MDAKAWDALMEQKVELENSIKELYDELRDVNSRIDDLDPGESEYDLDWEHLHELRDGLELDLADDERRLSDLLDDLYC